MRNVEHERGVSTTTSQRKENTNVNHFKCQLKEMREKEYDDFN